MSNKKIANILSIIEIAENNLKTAKNLLNQIGGESLKKEVASSTKQMVNPEEQKALEVVEGYFDGQSMVGDNGQIYPVPQNYASKTQLIIGDRMKWILTTGREIFKLIQPADRERVIGTFGIEGDSFVCLVDSLPEPVKILKASATFAMKNLDLRVGDDIAIIIPKKTTPVWGAFSSVVKTQEEAEAILAENQKAKAEVSELDNLDEFKIDSESSNDYF